MKKIQIFEPAMCCDTGLCGASVDPELLRISTTLNTLWEKGIAIQRFNLSHAPQEFVNNKVVNDFVNQYGVDNLPITLVDGEIRIVGHYPSNAEFTDWLGLPAGILGGDDNAKKSSYGCCSEGGCC